MLQAYMDDSGTHDGSHNCVVAGYWAGVNEWRRFEREWNGILRREGIREFKANEFWPRLKEKRLFPYTDWSDERHAKFIADLLTTIGKFKIVPFVAEFSEPMGHLWSFSRPLAARTTNTMS